jgi:GT2 family glycosyltransferase
MHSQDLINEMITVVISTRKTEEDYLKRIRESAGVDVQILCYENNREYSLTQLYNRGLDEAKNDIVVFMHDDLILEKNSRWGLKLQKAFDTYPFGILGKAGTTIMRESAKWWEDAGSMVGKVYHQAFHPKQQKIVKWASEYSFNISNNIIPVVAVDGLFFAVHKGRIKKRFDETIEGFHMYDIDFCLNNHLEGVKIGVVFDFDITHKSIGETNQEWEMNRVKVSQKYAGRLPTNVGVELFYDAKEVKLKKKKENQPWVSVVVPTKGKVELITQLLESICDKTTYTNYEVIIADTGSTDDEKKQIKQLILYHDAMTINNQWKKSMIVRLVEYDYYNFAKINNDVVRNHLNPKSELVVFCNNDIVFINDCLTLMVQTYLENRPTCGTIGARLHFQDNLLQHAGIFIGRTKKTRHIRAGHIGYKTGYQYKNQPYQVIGNTAALMLVSRTLFNKIGGFNETYDGCFEDVELNLEMLVRNCKNILCGNAVAYHLESQTRDGSILQTDYDKLTEYANKHSDAIDRYVIEI